MAGRYDLIGGAWGKVKKRYDRVGGAWTQVKKRYDKVAGVWVPSYTSGIPVTYDHFECSNSTPTCTNLSDSDNLRLQINKAALFSDIAYRVYFKFTAPTNVPLSSVAISCQGSFSVTAPSDYGVTYLYSEILSYTSLVAAVQSGYKSGTMSGSMTLHSSGLPITAGDTVTLLLYWNLGHSSDGGIYDQTATITIPWSTFVWTGTGEPLTIAA